MNSSFQGCQVEFAVCHTYAGLSYMDTFLLAGLGIWDQFRGVCLSDRQGSLQSMLGFPGLRVGLLKMR